MNNIKDEVIKRLESIYDLEAVKKSDPEGYKNEYEKMKHMISLNLRDRLKELSKSVPYNTEHGFNKDEFLELCNKFNIELSYNAKNWLCEKVDYIITGGCSYRGYFRNKEYRELMDAMEAMDIIENYPEEIEDYKEENMFIQNIA